MNSILKELENLLFCCIHMELHLSVDDVETCKAFLFAFSNDLNNFSLITFRLF